MNISVVLITLNASAYLEKCLSSCRGFDEILVVDSGSVDNTIEIAQNFGAKVIHQPWLGFGPQKQFAVRQAKHDWVFCLDADEWISEKLLIEINQLNLQSRERVFSMPRCNKFMGRFLRHGEGYPDRCIRLFDRKVAQWSEDLVHETVHYHGPIGQLQADLMHESGEDLGRYLYKQNQYTTLQAEQLFTTGKRASWVKICLSPLFRWIKFYFVRCGFLDGIPGIVHITIGCMNSMMKYAKLAEMNRQEKNK